MGSLISFLMVFQVITGVLLTLFYSPRSLLAFRSVDFLTRETVYGVFIRVIHLNFASLIFLFLFLHMFRGLYFSSFKQTGAWLRGSGLFGLSMLSAFLGYVLPWGQISFWGATVITNLVRTLPFLGPSMVLWLWGGFRVNKATLSLFFTLHFLTPLAILAGIILHLLFLHESSSTSPIFLHERFSKVKFTPRFSLKDISNFALMGLAGGVFIFSPWSLGDPENWVKANPIQTPVHILPEWYFLFAYAILRAIPSKLGGVVALVTSILVLFFLPFLAYRKDFPWLGNKCFAASIPYIFVGLTFLGASPVESPYLEFSQGFTVVYFFIFSLLVCGFKRVQTPFTEFFWY
jgi:ubiquinol-cytochrome c reductase cytochrome b subunit